MGRVEDLENWGYAEDQQGTCIFARGRAWDQGKWDGRRIGESGDRLGIIGGLIASPGDGLRIRENGTGEGSGKSRIGEGSGKVGMG
jgi:hypothetical protein